MGSLPPAGKRNIQFFSRSIFTPTDGLQHVHAMLACLARGVAWPELAEGQRSRQLLTIGAKPPHAADLG